MPGFKILGTQSAQNNPPTPLGQVYLYTWDIEQLLDWGVRSVADPLIYAKTVTLPSMTFDAEEYDTGHTQYKFAKGLKWADVKITFYDTHNLVDILRGMVISDYSGRSNTMWDSSNGLKVASDYMADTILRVYYSDWQVAYRWVLKNSWIKGLSFSELTYESSGINLVTVTVTYSYAEFKGSDSR